MISEVEKKSIDDLKHTLKISDELFEEVGEGLIDARSSLQIQTVLNLIQTQNKMIELMADDLRILYAQCEPCEMETMQKKECAKYENCFECIIEYFRNKAKEE